MQEVPTERRSGWLGPLIAGLVVLLVGVAAVVVVVRHPWQTTATGSATPIPVAVGTATPDGDSPSPTGDGAGKATVTIAAAGDIACGPADEHGEDGDGKGPRQCQMNSVGAMVTRARPAAFLALGDDQYENGSLEAFRNGYAKAFGALLPVTHPEVGNHEYLTQAAAGYFDYFGSRAGKRGQGWYSFDLGGWHIVALNSNCEQVGCRSGSPQLSWLKADLAAHPTRCTLAYWHHPRWSSGQHGNNEAVADLVSTLVAGGADVILNGHDHDYERFRRQAADGTADQERGVREFVVGTGGRSLREAKGTDGTELVNSDTFGALFLTLSPTSYTWQFHAASGSFTDTGATPCS